MFAAKDRLNTHLTGIMVNISINQEAVNYLSVDYAALLGVPADKVKLESTDFSDLTTDLSEENYNASMIIVNEVSAKILDYMILDKLGMEFYTGQEVYMDLRDFFSLEELQAFLEKDQLIFCLEEAAADKSAEELKALQKECLTEAGKEIEYCWPAAVKITDMEFVKKNITNEGNIYFALAGSSQKMQQLRDFWEYIKAYK